MKPPFKWILGGFLALAIAAVIDWNGAGLLAKPFLCNDPELGVKVFAKIPASELGGWDDSPKHSLCPDDEKWICTPIGKAQKYEARLNFEVLYLRIRRAQQKIMGPNESLIAREVRYIFQSGIPFFESGAEWGASDLCSSSWGSGNKTSKPKLENSMFIDFGK